MLARVEYVFAVCGKPFAKVYVIGIASEAVAVVRRDLNSPFLNLF
jgi:hypothetical protein